MFTTNFSSSNRQRTLSRGLQHFSSAQSVTANTKHKRRGLLYTIKLWNERSRQRRELRRLANDADLLKDVGLSIYNVQNEGIKPFWRE